MQIKPIMRNFAFLTDIIFAIGDFFTWAFQILPIIGIVMNWIFVVILAGLLFYWMVEIVKSGKEDKRMVDYREPHNFID